ncbi:sugar kinase [Carnobacterium gallinarum]|uniref:sugar kinase n=1 Tax=Carnobacterium gallinarum TaxID=2749 RepID=UPI0005564051|nr:sugar kinase [Carnobacterium gallinarum]
MKILAFGEVMMRLTPPHYKLIEQTDTLDLAFNGSGVNMLSSLAHFGYDTTILTTLPANQVGRAAAGTVRKLGIKDELIGYRGDHIGLYFLEMGFGNRPAEVTYLNRLASSFGESTLSDYDLDQAVASADIIHICGIALMLAEGTREVAFALAEKAHKAGKFVCFDFNYRPSLNKENGHEWVKDQFHRMLPNCDLVIGGIRDLTELIDLPVPANLTDEVEILRAVSQVFSEKFDVAYFAGTIRGQVGEQRGIRGFLRHQAEFFVSRPFAVEIYDRIGTGDAYAAGILAGIIEKWTVEKTVDFATSNGVLTHTTFGDSPLIRKEIVEAFSRGELGDVIR